MSDHPGVIARCLESKGRGGYFFHALSAWRVTLAIARLQSVDLQHSLQ
jgi:hypothetical protein